MSLLLTLTFFLALTTSTYFFSKIGSLPVNPLTHQQISKYTLVGLASCILWAIVFCGVLQVIN